VNAQREGRLVTKIGSLCDEELLDRLRALARTVPPARVVEEAKAAGRARLEDHAGGD
jgi:hypothetical protein